MVKKCCIKTCKSESYSGCGISFHSFPRKQDIKQRWMDVIVVSQKITKNSVVCSRHFEPEDFYEANSRRMIKSNAVPSIFPPPINKQTTVLSGIKIEPNITQESSIGTALPSPSTSSLVETPMKWFSSSTMNKPFTVLSGIKIEPNITQESSIGAASPSPSRSSSVEPPMKWFCSSVKDAAVQTDICRHSSPAEDMLKHRVKILSQRLHRRDIKLKNLKSILAMLNKKTGLHLR